MQVKKKSSVSPFKVVMCALLIVYAVTLFLPMLWGLMTTFKAQAEFRKNVLGLPQDWTIENYTTALTHLYLDVRRGVSLVRVPFTRMFLYSVLYAGGCALATTVTTCVMSYASARFPQYKLSKVIYYIVVVCMILPVVGSLPSEINMSQMFGLYNKIWGLWIMKISFLGMYFLVFYATFRSLPDDYAEAARIDGAGELRIMVQIFFPLARYTFMTILLLYFIQYWNDYQVPLIYLPAYPTVAYGVFSFGNSGDAALANVPVKITACIITIIPILILFLIFHKRLIGNVSMGGLKE